MQCVFYCIEIYKQPVCATDVQLKISVEVYEQFISLAWYSITERSPFSGTRTHPQADREIRQCGHAWDFDNVIDSFVRKIERRVVWNEIEMVKCIKCFFFRIQVDNTFSLVLILFSVIAITLITCKIV